MGRAYFRAVAPRVAASAAAWPTQGREQQPARSADSSAALPEKGSLRPDVGVHVAPAYPPFAYPRCREFAPVPPSSLRPAAGGACALVYRGGLPTSLLAPRLSAEFVSRR